MLPPFSLFRYPSGSSSRLSHRIGVGFFLRCVTFVLVVGGVGTPQGRAGEEDG